MKKVLAGCLIVLVIAVIGFGVAGYYAYRWAQPMIQNTGDYLERARQMARLGDRIQNRAPYVPPASGELTTSGRSVRRRAGARARGARRAVGGNRNQVGGDSREDAE